MIFLVFNGRQGPVFLGVSRYEIGLHSMRWITYRATVGMHGMKEGVGGDV